MSAYVKGKGTESEPYVINSVAGIKQLLTTDSNKGIYAVLACDVEMSESDRIVYSGLPSPIVFTLDCLGRKLKILTTNTSTGYGIGGNNCNFTIKNGEVIFDRANTYSRLFETGLLTVVNVILYSNRTINASNTIKFSNSISKFVADSTTGSSNSFSIGVTVSGLTRVDTLSNPYDPAIYSSFDKSIWVVDGNSYPRLIPRTIPYITQFWAVKGIVKVGGIPAKRRITAHHPVDFYLISETESNEVDGAYSIDCGGYTDHIYVIHSDKYGNKFSANKSYVVGDVIHPSSPNGYRYICGIAGISASTAPADWPINSALVSGGASFDPKPVYSPCAHMVTPVLYDSVTGLPV
jgi:hypothetical protein